MALTGRLWPKVELDPVVVTRRLHADVTTEVSRLRAAELLDLRRFGERVEFPVEAVEPAGGFRVFSEPGAPFPAGGVQFVPLFLEIGDGLVEATDLGAYGPDVGDWVCPWSG